MKTLTAYDVNDNALFFRLVKNKEEGRKEVLNSTWLHRVERIKYNNRNYNIKELYKGW